MTLYRWGVISVIFGLGLTSCAVKSDEGARIAVATNFLQTAEILEEAFEAKTDYEIDLVSGSTGHLYTQIVNGAPYDVFLSADAARVARLSESAYGVAGTEFTYAKGQIVVFGTESPEADLKANNFNKLAIANPDLAPYGLAAKQALHQMKVYEAAEPKLIYGQNVGQAYGFVATGNTDLGIAALSQLNKSADIYWVIPKGYYEDILQDGILLSVGKNNKSARAFLNYLKTPAAQNIIEQAGYKVGPS